MTALAENIDANQTTIRVDTALGPTEPTSGRYFRIDDELVLLRGTSRGDTSAGDKTTWTVDRGVNGTTKATHTASVSLTEVVSAVGTSAFTAGGGVTVDNQSDPPTAVSTLVVPGATIIDSQADLSGLAGVQRVRLLGPYRVMASELGEYEQPYFFGDLIAPNSLVVACYLVHREFWVSGVADVVLEIDVAEPGDFENTAAVVLQSQIVSGSNSANRFPEPSDFVIGLGAPGVLGSDIVRSTAALTHDQQTQLVAWVDDATGLTGGAADIYALIAEPAS